MSQYSKNKWAERVVGRRIGIPNLTKMGRPCHHGYHCPKCKYDLVVDGEYDNRLHFSEYVGFMWCEVCNQDYPSCICLPHDPELATKVFLNTVESSIKRAGTTVKRIRIVKSKP